ncbi:50S ribosomal protein L6 [Candidatus Woesearchaeota archaeon]|nr:50S ribosomal protein L6 [Candidatus Woesearchaeota archaeon]MBI2581791.1 50S ribosomal protein L6 [Candidatus Woesearchaeota archaeon]
MKDDLRKEVELGPGVTANVHASKLTVKGPKGEVSRIFLHPKVTLSLEGDKIVLLAPKATKREKTILGAFYSHIKNMVHGVKEPYIYRLKICSGHFPMNVAVSGNELVIKNFLGEAVPRRVEIIQGAEVKVNGEEIVVKSCDVEVAGQTAAKIETACRITNRDRRIFQDGCYIFDKAGSA